MKNKILIVLALVIILIGGYFLINQKPSGNIQIGNEDLNKYDEIVPNLSGLEIPIPKEPKDIAWDLFQKYLSYNQYLKLAEIKSVVYKVSPVCDLAVADPACVKRMSDAYSFGKELKKEDFTNVWQDEKQIILSTDFKLNTDTNVVSRGRSIIFFVYNESGELKLLSFSPFKGAMISRGVASEEELLDRAITYTEDGDNDGLADYDEQCLDLNKSAECIKTNHKSRDSDGDGFWDGVDVLMK